MKHALLGVALLALVGFGIWLGRSIGDSHRSTPAVAEPSAAPVTTAPPPAAVARAQIPPQPTLRARATTASEPLPGLARDLVAADPKIRRAAVAELAKSSDPDVGALLAASRDGDVDVAITATSALRNAYANGQVPAKDMIARATDRVSSVRVRMTALGGLGAVENADAARVFIDLLAHGDVGERRAAAGLLANQDPRVAVPALIDALGDADEYVRMNALEALKARSRGRDFGEDAAAWRAWWASQR